VSTPGGLSWQGGWDEPGVLSLLIIETGIPGSGLFLYNGVPGLGTLLASVTESSTDPFGNTTQPGGFVVYDGNAYIDVHVNTTIGAPAIEQVTGAGSEAEHTAFYTVVTSPLAVNESMAMVLTGPGSTADNVQAQLQLLSAAKNSSSLAAGTLVIDTNGSLANKAFWDTTGFQTATSPTGTGWYVNGTLTDTSTNTAGNTATSATAITAAWTIPANDANVGTVYEIEVPFTGTEETAVLNLGMLVDGSTNTNLVPVAGSAITAGHGFAGTVRLRLICTATGSGGTYNLDMKGELQDSSINRTAATSLTLNGHAGGHSLSTNASHTVAVSAFWGSNVASETISGITSKFTRAGQ
jgi:hypothetical protein